MRHRHGNVTFNFTIVDIVEEIEFLFWIGSMKTIGCLDSAANEITSMFLTFKPKPFGN